MQFFKSLFLIAAEMARILEQVKLMNSIIAKTRKYGFNYNFKYSYVEFVECSFLEKIILELA